MTLITQYHFGLRDLDETDIESLFGLAGYAVRKNTAPKSGARTAQPNTITLHGKVYNRTQADRFLK